MRATRISIVLGVVAFGAMQVRAAQTFEAVLIGTSSVPANASPGTGLGTVVLNDAGNQITVNENWSGLLAPATASHIHGPSDTSHNAGVLFPFSGVPAATSGAIPQQTFAITPAQVADLEAGLYYFNIHTSVFPGGEIRGQIVAVPEPASLSLLALATGGFLLRRRRA